MVPETFLTEMLKQAPIVAALVYMVVLFLKHIRESDTVRETLLSKRDEALSRLGDNCHEFQRSMATRNDETFVRMADAMDRNTEALGRNHEAMVRFHATMDRVEDFLGKPKKAGGKSGDADDRPRHT